MDITDTAFLFSGGAANSNPSVSLGGVISNTGPALQSFSQLSTIPGITIAEVGGMEPGVAEFSYDGSLNRIKLRPPDKASGAYVTVSGFGDHNTLLAGGSTGEDGYAILSVIEASLSGVSYEENSTIAITSETIFPNVTNAQAATGVIQHRCLFLKNNHGTTNIIRLGIYLAYNTPGEDTIAYAIDTDAGVGDGSTTGVPVDIVTEGDPGNLLNSLTFESSIDPVTSQEIIANIGPGQCVPIWLRRTVPAFVSEAVADNGFTLGLRIYVDA